MKISAGILEVFPDKNHRETPGSIPDAIHVGTSDGTLTGIPGGFLAGILRGNPSRIFEGISGRNRHRVPGKYTGKILNGKALQEIFGKIAGVIPENP